MAQAPIEVFWWLIPESLKRVREKQREVENSGEGKTYHKPLPKNGFGPPTYGSHYANAEKRAQTQASEDKREQTQIKELHPLLRTPPFQSRFLGRGCGEALFSEKKGFSVKSSSHFGSRLAQA